MPAVCDLYPDLVVSGCSHRSQTIARVRRVKVASQCNRRSLGLELLPFYRGADRTPEAAGRKCSRTQAAFAAPRLFRSRVNWRTWPPSEIGFATSRPFG